MGATGFASDVRGKLATYGLILPQSVRKIIEDAAGHIEQQSHELRELRRELVELRAEVAAHRRAEA